MHTIVEAKHHHMSCPVTLKHLCICTPLADKGNSVLHRFPFSKHFVGGEIPSGILNQILVLLSGLQMLQPGKQDRTSFHLVGKHLCDDESSSHITPQPDVINVCVCSSVAG